MKYVGIDVSPIIIEKNKETFPNRYPKNSCAEFYIFKKKCFEILYLFNKEYG